MKVIKILFVVSLFFSAGSNQKLSFAQSELSAADIIAKSRLAFYYAGSDTRAKVLMELINKDGQKRVRELTMLRKDYEEGGNQKYFMYFHKPADVKDTAFMVYKFPDKDDERWVFFFPPLKLQKKKNKAN